VAPGAGRQDDRGSVAMPVDVGSWSRFWTPRARKENQKG